VQEHTPGDRTKLWSDQKSLLPDPVSAEVSKLLYERNLISDPEVNRKMNDVVLQISRDGVAPQSAMPLFFRWLEDWASKHPAQVEAARLAGGAYTLDARRTYIDTDSAREAQIDSIRRLIRESATRRIEAAQTTRRPRRATD
jgi:hypothetical protein